jgi:outer membrane protein OmpA-like peptidoglycan-associated protein
MLETFGTAVAALPKAPLSATLYFLLGKDQLTPQSRQDAETIYGDFVQRQAPEVLIVGHTDTVGSAKTNQKLSEKRAEKVRQGLIVLGVPSASIQASGRGERELLVATPDNTKEPRNRRVEISVR